MKEPAAPKQKYVTINVDSSFNPGKQTGGYGIWISHSNFTIKKWGQLKGIITDANEAEIKGLANALYYLHQKKLFDHTVVINCDNSTVRNLVNREIVNDRFYTEGRAVLAYKKYYPKMYAKNIKGHVAGGPGRNYVNNWCDTHSRAYLSGGK